MLSAQALHTFSIEHGWADDWVSEQAVFAAALNVSKST
jgi:hypothetical protein